MLCANISRHLSIKIKLLDSVVRAVKSNWRNWYRHRSHIHCFGNGTFIGNKPDSKHFLTRIQQYNNYYCFQMTSFEALKANFIQRSRLVYWKTMNFYQHLSVAKYVGGLQLKWCINWKGVKYICNSTNCQKQPEVTRQYIGDRGMAVLTMCFESYVVELNSGTKNNPLYNILYYIIFSGSDLYKRKFNKINNKW